MVLTTLHRCPLHTCIADHDGRGCEDTLFRNPYLKHTLQFVYFEVRCQRDPLTLFNVGKAPPLRDGNCVKSSAFSWTVSEVPKTSDNQG